MPKAKRLNGIWSGRARRALGAAVIAMVLVFARTLAALGQGTPQYPGFILEIIKAYETKIDGDENLKDDEKKQRIDEMKAYVDTDKELCLHRAFDCSDEQVSGDFFSSPEFANLF